MLKEYTMEGDIKLLIWPALDSRFQPGISDAGFRWWWDRGITAVCKLTHRGLLKSFGGLQKEFGLKNKKFFWYLQTRDYYDKRIKPSLSREGNTVIDTLTEAYKQKIEKLFLKFLKVFRNRMGTTQDTRRDRTTGVLRGVHSIHLQVQRSGEYSAGKTWLFFSLHLL